MPPGTNDYVRRSGQNRQQPIRYTNAYSTAAAEQAANPRPAPRRMRTVEEMVRHMDRLPAPVVGRILEAGRSTRAYLDYANARPDMSAQQQRVFSFEIPLPPEWWRMAPDDRQDYVEQYIRTPSAQLQFDASQVSESPLNEDVHLRDESAWMLRRHESNYIPPDDSDEEEEDGERDGERDGEEDEPDDETRQRVNAYIDEYIEEVEAGGNYREPTDDAPLIL